MAKWLQFENDCLEYLQRNYGARCKFVPMGKADSTTSDILACTSIKKFYIEVKEPNAQSGQFVLLPNVDTKKFIFSPKNKTDENEFTSIIMEYLNKDFEKFNAAGTAGQEIDIDKSIFYNWIENYYKSKNVKYFITKGNKYIIFPVSEFHNYFNVSATYRIKRSGSSEPSNKYRDDILKILMNNYKVTNYINERKKLFVNGDKSMNKIRFIMGNYEYYLANKGNEQFEVRQLSNTYNMNVIFSISLNSSQKEKDLELFKKDLI